MIRNMIEFFLGFFYTNKHNMLSVDKINIKRSKNKKFLIINDTSENSDIKIKDIGISSLNNNIAHNLRNLEMEIFIKKNKNQENDINTEENYKNDSRYTEFYILHFIVENIAENLGSKILKIFIGTEILIKNITSKKKFHLFVNKNEIENIYLEWQKDLNTKETMPRFIKNIETPGIITFNTARIRVERENETIFLKNPKNIFYTCDSYLKTLIKTESKKLSMFKKIINYFMFSNSRFSLENSSVIVKDFHTGELQKEKMYKKTSFALTFLFAKRLVESRIYKKIVKKLTKRIGKKFDSPKSAQSIKKFIDYFKIDMTEVEHPIEDFHNFNEFFRRSLKKGARKIEDKKGISSPADCRLLTFKSIEEAKTIWIKGKKFTVESLLRKADKCASIFICRLAPQDYHRFHSPTSGIIKKIKYVHGEYLTVHPVSIKKTDVLTENTRVIIEIETDDYGLIYYVAVGATLVGSVIINVDINTRVETMDELGYFEFGGSTIVLLFKNKINLNKYIYENTLMGIETLVKVGNCIAKNNL